MRAVSSPSHPDAALGAQQGTAGVAVGSQSLGCGSRHSIAITATATTAQPASTAQKVHRVSPSFCQAVHCGGQEGPAAKELVYPQDTSPHHNTHKSLGWRVKADGPLRKICLITREEQPEEGAEVTVRILLLNHLLSST